MDEIMDKAAELAKAMTVSDTFKKLKAAEGAVEKDEAASKLMTEYGQLAQKVQTKEKNLEPVEVAEKQSLSELQDKVKSNSLLQELLQAQTDFAHMMAQVNQTIESNLGD